MEYGREEGEKRQRTEAKKWNGKRMKERDGEWDRYIWKPEGKTAAQ
jgi:hypothetical protein